MSHLSGCEGFSVVSIFPIARGKVIGVLAVFLSAALHDSEQLASWKSWPAREITAYTAPGF